jgi:nitrogen fixation protein NifM
MDKQKRRYLTIKIATEKFKLNPEFLSSVQQGEVMVEVEKLHRLQCSILKTREAQKVAVTTPQLMEAFLRCSEQFESEAEFYQTLKKQGLTVEGFKQALRDELHCEKVLEQVSRDIPELNRSQAEEYYQRNKLEFSRARTWRMSQVLITINDEFSENSRGNALKRIHEVREKAQSTPLAELAMIYSECPSALENGYLGWCEEGKLYPAITDALYSLEKETVSPVIETEVGFHLVLWHEQREPYLAPFSEVWPFLQEKHTSRAKAFRQREWLRGLAH